MHKNINSMLKKELMCRNRLNWWLGATKIVRINYECAEKYAVKRDYSLKGLIPCNHFIAYF